MTTLTNVCHYCEKEYKAKRMRYPGYCSGSCRTRRSRDAARLAKLETEALSLRVKLKLPQS